MFSVIVLLYYHLNEVNCCTLVWSSLSLEHPSLGCKFLFIFQTPLQYFLLPEAFLNYNPRDSPRPLHLAEPRPPYVPGSVCPRWGRGGSLGLAGRSVLPSKYGDLPLADPANPTFLGLAPSGSSAVHLLVPLDEIYIR